MICKFTICHDIIGTWSVKWENDVKLSSVIDTDELSSPYGAYTHIATDGNIRSENIRCVLSG